jgi:hypothetical protein
VRDFSQLEQALIEAAAISRRVVIKANWGMSARERLLVNVSLTDPDGNWRSRRRPARPDPVVHSSLTEADRNWIGKRLSQQGIVFIEPWVNRLEEVGIQCQIPVTGKGSPIIVGTTKLVSDDAGQYRGSWFTDPPEVALDFGGLCEFSVLKATERLQQLGYFGPVGIDALRYRLPDGTIGLRPLQDINARWTMGRLALGWRRRFPQAKFGFWWHGPADQTPAWPDGNFPSTRIIRSSPECIGGIPARHASYLLLSPA